jgi:hypothetical protein
MFGFGGKSKPCCGATSQPETKFFPTVPECPGQIPFNAAGCVSNKGKFYDKILHDLLVPISGQGVNAYVCEPDLWSTCQWIAACYGSNDIAVFKVTGIAGDHIKLVNACSDGGAIEDNPAPGSVIKAGSVIYPIPPPWCSDELCNKLTAALENGDCACQGVLSCLQNSEEICFSALPAIEDGEELHLFGGSMLTNEGNENDNPSLWKSCLKKLHEIFTGYTGKSICFADLPETTTAPDIIDWSPVAKRTVLLDGNGCLRKGPIVTAGSCDAELDITIEDDDIHIPEDDDEGLNAKGRLFDALKVCREGVERVLIPSAECMAIHSVKDEDNNYYWEEVRLGGRIFMLTTPLVIGDGVNGNLTDYEKYKRIAGDCSLYAIVSCLFSNTGANSSANSAYSCAVNGVLAGIAAVVGATRSISYQACVPVPLTSDLLSVSFSQAGSGGTLGGVTMRLRGYIVGTAQLS